MILHTAPAREGPSLLSPPTGSRIERMLVVETQCALPDRPKPGRVRDMARDDRIREALISRCRDGELSFTEMRTLGERMRPRERWEVDDLEWEYAAWLSVAVKDAYEAHGGEPALHGVVVVEAIGINWQRVYKRPQTSTEFHLVWDAIGVALSIPQDLPTAARIEPLHRSLFERRTLPA